jgi:fusion and transport protein UGO1
MSSSPVSLRDLYNSPPASPWSFVPPPPSSNSPAPSQNTSYEWSTRSPRNVILDFAPGDGESVAATLRALALAALTEYSLTAVAMPWEVGKTLLQVQWVPRHTSVQQPDLGDELDDDDQDVSLAP